MPDDTIPGNIALLGQPPAKTTPYGVGLRFDKEEEDAAVAAIRSQKLWYKQGGTRVATTEKAICAMWNVKHAILCSSGTAAIHTALAMCGVEAGDEIIVNTCTDWGSIAGILALGAVPVFCDIDDTTYSLDPHSIERLITSKTRAIELVHLSGYPAHVREIVEIANRHGVMVVEDCAQSPLASLGGRMLGTFGNAGAFSTNDSKHISCGEGGFVITNDDDMARIARLFIDKAYSKGGARGRTDVSFLGMNYRMSELSAAVLEVQLKKLPNQLACRRAYAQQLISAMTGCPGYRLLQVEPEAESSYWTILGHLEMQQFRVSREEIVKALAAEGIPVWAALAPARTIYGTSAIRSGMLYPQKRTGPVQGLVGIPCQPHEFPVTERIVDSVIPLSCSPFFTKQDAEETVRGVTKVLQYYHV